MVSIDQPVAESLVELDEPAGWFRCIQRHLAIPRRPCSFLDLGEQGLTNPPALISRIDSELTEMGDSLDSVVRGIMRVTADRPNDGPNDGTPDLGNPAFAFLATIDRRFDRLVDRREVHSILAKSSIGPMKEPREVLEVVGGSQHAECHP